MTKHITVLEESHPMTLTSFLKASASAPCTNTPHRPSGRLMASGLLLCIGVSVSLDSWAQVVPDEPSVRPRLRVERTISAVGGTLVSPQSMPYTQSPAPVPLAAPQPGLVGGYPQQQLYYPVTVYMLAPPPGHPQVVPQVPPQQPYPPVQAQPPQLAQPAYVAPPAQSMPPAQAPAASTQEPWQVNLTDQTMSILLRRWAAQAGWQLVWEAERDFLIDSNFSLQGDFLTVLESVMRSVQRSDYPLQAVANSRTRVLRIVRYMDGQRN